MTDKVTAEQLREALKVWAFIGKDDGLPCVDRFREPGMSHTPICKWLREQ
jgi:hypothetical protein